MVIPRFDSSAVEFLQSCKIYEGVKMKRFSQAELCEKVSDIEDKLYEFSRNSQTKGYADLSTDLADIRLLLGEVRASLYLRKDAFERAIVAFREEVN